MNQLIARLSNEVLVRRVLAEIAEEQRRAQLYSDALTLPRHEFPFNDYELNSFYVTRGWLWECIQKLNRAHRRLERTVRYYLDTY